MRSESAAPLAALLFLAGLLAIASSGVRAEDPPPRDGEVVPDSGVVERVQVVLRRLDFLVLDRKGRPITDLRKDEVRLWDSGDEQELLDLLPVHERREDAALVAAAPRPTTEGRPRADAAPAEPASQEADAAAPPPAPASSAAAMPRGRWIVLYFDANNLSLQGRLRAGAEVRRLVENLSLIHI